MIGSSIGCLQAVGNECESVGNEREQSVSPVCNESEQSNAMFASRGDYVCKLLHLESLPALEKWPGLQAVIAVETIRMAHKQAPVTSDSRFYLASLRRSAIAFVTLIRQHWDIENKLHWSLDVTFNEDRCRIRKDHAPENMVAMRHITLNLLRQEPTRHMSLRQKKLLYSLDEHSLLTMLSRAT